MDGFSGFPPGKQRLIQIPGLFFSELLPCIDNLFEMKITLYCMWALQSQEGKFRYIRFTEVLKDDIFMDGINVHPDKKAEAIQEGFDRAVARGTFLRVKVHLAAGDEDIYFLNTAKGREAVKAIEKGHWIPGDEQRPIQLVIERPNVYVIYEQNIGALTPMIADQLRDLEQDYPVTWIEEAIKIAAESQIRKLRFIIGILEKWRKEGRTKGSANNSAYKNETSRERIARLESQYADLIED